MFLIFNGSRAYLSSVIGSFPKGVKNRGIGRPNRPSHVEHGGFMRLLKYTDGWTRRHFLEQTAKGIFAAGVLAPLWEAIGNTGTVDAAYPPELLSIEEYTKGRLKIGGELNAGNVDIVKDILDPAAYFQIKHDGRVCKLAPTETNINYMTPPPFLAATLRNKGKHKIFPDGNVYTLDGKPWIGGNPFPEPKTAQEVMMANTLSWGKHDDQQHSCMEFDTDADGNIQYEYQWSYVEWQCVGRTVFDPKPYQPGHEHQLRITGDIITAPEDQRGTSFLQVWAYDQRLFPEFYGYTPLLKRTRSFPTDQRFEPLLPGNTFFATEAWMAGDPLLTWGNFKLVGKGPLLTCAHHCSDLENPNWLHPTCGGKTGKKYYQTRMELVPETYIVEMSPVHYPRAPYSKKRIWYHAATLCPLTMITYDRQGKMWQQWEGGFDWYKRKPGMKWIEGVPEEFWSWTHVHAHDLQDGRMSRFQIVQQIIGGYPSTVDNPKLFGEFCSMDALRRLGR